MLPTRAGPVLMPIPKSGSCGISAREVVDTRRAWPTAARAARIAWSAWRVGALKTAITRVARVVDDRSLVLEEARDHRGVVAVEERDDLFGLVLLRVGRESAEVGEERSDLHDRATERGLVGIGQEPGDDGRRQVAPEQ